jgi:UDP-N-acetylmuramoylalanine-D-glutamate ligase
MFIKHLTYWRNKKILILGFGREGRDTLRFLQARFPGINLGIADKKPSVQFITSKFKIHNAKCKMTIQNSKFIKLSTGQRINLHLGKDYLEALRRYDVIIKSPGIPPKVIAPYLTKKQIVTSAAEIFFENCPGTIIGVTGTKGKSTTTSMIYKILRDGKDYLKNNSRIHLVGNIGRPALSLLEKAKKDDIFVYELSSHQLYGLKKSPHIAVFLNIYPEHLDYYRSFKEYAAAKANICRWQTKQDYFIYNSKDKLVRSFAKKSKAKKIPIQGKYYELDREAARAVGKIFGIPKNSIENSLKTFHFLPNRLEHVGTFRGITFYNDSLATIPQATIEALNTLGNKVETLIAGGYDRGVNFDNLAKKILESTIQTLILFQPSGKRIQLAVDKIKMCDKKFPSRKIKYFFATNMKEAINFAYQYTQRGCICLLSPASASFGLFKNYQTRGNAFKKWIRYFGTKGVV